MRFLLAGYLYKHVARRPDWDAIPTHVEDVYSISGCHSENFADYIKYWRHNGHWLFDVPEIMHDIAKAEDLDLAPLALFYYEIFPEEFDRETGTWTPFAADDFPTNVIPPASRRLEGFDIVAYSQRNAPECSPLCCNGLADRVPVNTHCLIPTFEDAKRALSQGHFSNAEPGPYRILAVHSVS